MSSLCRIGQYRALEDREEGEVLDVHDGVEGESKCRVASVWLAAGLEVEGLDIEKGRLSSPRVILSIAC